MKVCVFVSSLNGGGAERSMIAIANGLSLRDHEVALVAARDGGDLVELVSRNVELIFLGCKRTVGATLPLASFLRRRRPSVVVSAMDVPNMVAVFASRACRPTIPTVVSYRTNVSAAAALDEGVVARLRPLLARAVSSAATEVVAISEGVADDLRRLNRRLGQVSVIYNPTVSESLYREARPEPRDLGPPGDGPLLLAVGRLAPEKGYDVLLEGFTQVREQRPDARLLILGEGPLRHSLTRRAQDLGLVDAVSMPGFVPNPGAYMARCAVFVHTARREGLGNVLVEAGALGARIVATDCPSGPREILAGRAQAALVPMDNPGVLAREVTRMLAAPRVHTSAEDWAQHTVEASTNGYEEVCRRATDRY